MILEISSWRKRVATIVRQRFNLTSARWKRNFCCNTHLVLQYFDRHFTQRIKCWGKGSLMCILYLTASKVVEQNASVEISLYEI